MPRKAVAAGVRSQLKSAGGPGLPLQMNYFEVFGLPRILNIDLKALEKTFHDLSRQYHPDYFSTAPPDERKQALEKTALLNDAYRTLRHPVGRVEYLLELEGFKPDGSKVPKAFLMEMFEINEQLEEVKSGAATQEQVATLRGEIKARAASFESQLSAASLEWDRAPSRDALFRLMEILSESSYIRNLERDLEGTP